MMSGSNNPSLLPQIGPDGLPMEAPVIAYTEKIIEEEQLQLKKYIEENYSKIRDVERELASLSMEMKLTAGPKKAALELLRKKVEASTEKIHTLKLKEEQTRKMWEAALKAVQEEEAVKQKLCEDLNKLVQESSTTQFSRLEELKRRLEALNPARSSVSMPSDGKSTGSLQSGKAQDAPVSALSIPCDATGNEINQQPSAEGEGKTKKKIHFQGRGKGIGAVPRDKASGWTGAGFDVR